MPTFLPSLVRSLCCGLGFALSRESGSVTILLVPSASRLFAVPTRVEIRKVAFQKLTPLSPASKVTCCVQAFTHWASTQPIFLSCCSQRPLWQPTAIRTATKQFGLSGFERPNQLKLFILLVPGGGVEPPRPCDRRILSPYPLLSSY
jgi:hypothetical protein